MDRLSWMGSLTKWQAVAIVAGLCWILPSGAAWLLFPKYLVEGKWEHHWVWDPPVIHVGKGPPLAREDLVRLSKDPRQAEILAARKHLPAQVPLHAHWVGNKHNGSRNLLFATFVLSLIAFAMILRWVGIW